MTHTLTTESQEVLLLCPTTRLTFVANTLDLAAVTFTDQRATMWVRCPYCDVWGNHPEDEGFDGAELQPHPYQRENVE